MIHGRNKEQISAGQSQCDGAEHKFQLSERHRDLWSDRVRREWESPRKAGLCQNEALFIVISPDKGPLIKKAENSILSVQDMIGLHNQGITQARAHKFLFHSQNKTNDKSKEDIPHLTQLCMFDTNGILWGFFFCFV